MAYEKTVVVTEDWAAVESRPTVLSVVVQAAAANEGTVYLRVPGYDAELAAGAVAHLVGLDLADVQVRGTADDEISFRGGTVLVLAAHAGGVEALFDPQADLPGGGGEGQVLTLNEDGQAVWGDPPPGEPGAAAFVYVAYASDDQGSDFTMTFSADLEYIAVKSTDAEIAEPQASDFAGLWAKYKGTDGTDGDDGVGLTFKIFGPETVFEINDITEFSGSGYICILGYTTGVEPTPPGDDGTHWNNLAQKGDKGDTGDSDIDLTNLPTSDPEVAGAPWNDSGTLKFSAGA